MKRLLKYFFQGLVFLAPIALTAYIFYEVFMGIDGWLNMPVPGLGFAITIALVVVVGFFTNVFLIGRIMRWFEKLLDRLPFVKLLHSAIKDLLSAVVGEKKSFDKPVLVQVTENTRVLGFVTRESVDELGLEDHVAVYLPQSYNFAGQVLLVPRDKIAPVPIASGDVMTFVISAGVTGK